jgi:hypothetical protein
MPLVNQFADMQKQMSDQFQQAIMMVVKMFTEMHQDQVDSMRKEVDRLQDLTQELHSLQNQLTTQPAVLNPRTLAEVTLEQTPEIKAAPSTPSETSTGDVQGRLFQRIEEIQQERQSRLQKILNFLSGK